VKREEDALNLQAKLVEDRRREYVERYAANPVEFIQILAREYERARPTHAYSAADHSRQLDRLCRRADNEFVYGHLSRALRQRVKSGGVAEVTGSDPAGGGGPGSD